jgi:hypothetical protein
MRPLQLLICLAALGDDDVGSAVNTTPYHCHTLFETVSRCFVWMSVFKHKMLRNAFDPEREKVYTVMSLAICSLHRILKAKAVPPHAMKALGGRGGIAPNHF